MMPHKGEKRSCQAAPLDILSSLPENLTDDVLSRLSLRDAVRTSILSKKWRYNWCRLPELKLDLANLTSTADFPRLMTDISSISILFSDVMCHLMTFHTGPITRFTLDIASCRNTTPNTDDLIYFLSKKSIQHLDLRFPWSSSSEKQYSLPSSFFACSQLRHLALNKCSIQLPPPEFKGFDRLISMKLHGVTISSKLLENIISHSPFLEKLLLHRVSMDVHIIEIDAPALRCFDFHGSLRSICLKNVPLLAELSLWQAAALYMKATRHFDVAKFFDSCCALERLHLMYSFLSREEGEAAGKVPTRLPFVLASVRHLSLFLCWLSGVNTSDIVDRAFCVIRSFPNLQFLEIQEVDHCKNDKLVDVGHYSDLTFDHLRQVNFDYFRGSMYGMELIKLLLAKSPVLVRVKISVARSVEESAPVEMLAMLAGLSKCKRASLEAEVVILYKRESYRVSFV